MPSFWRKLLWQGESSCNSDSGQTRAVAPLQDLSQNVLGYGLRLLHYLKNALAARSTSSPISSQQEPLQPVIDTPASYEAFRHEPLNLSENSFRLLNIRGVSPDGFVECTISEYNRDHLMQPYCALSYEWGPERSAGQILLNGKAFSVRQNLLSFLKSTPAHSAARKMIWIDAICIDQDNLFEKNHQVKQMAGIYRNAATVYAWLGEYHPEYNWTLDYYSPFPELYRRHEMEILQRSSYWGRMWIVQEITLAQGDVLVLYGKYSISWETFTSDPSFMSGASIPAVRVAKLADLLRSKSRPLTVLTLLRELNGGGLCADVRDKVYALLGMASDTRSLEPDYTITAEELFFRVLESEYSLAETNTITIDDVTVLCRALQVNFEDQRVHADIRTGSGQAEEPISIDVGTLEMESYQNCDWPGRDVVLQCGCFYHLKSSNSFIDPLELAFTFTKAHTSMNFKTAVILRRAGIGRYACVAMAEYECFNEDGIFFHNDAVADSRKRCFFYDLPRLHNALPIKLHVQDGSIDLSTKATLNLTNLVGSPPPGSAQNMPSDLHFLWIKSGNGLVDDLIRTRRLKCIKLKGRIASRPNTLGAYHRRRGLRIPFRNYDELEASATPHQIEEGHYRAPWDVPPHNEAHGSHQDDGDPICDQIS